MDKSEMEKFAQNRLLIPIICFILGILGSIPYYCESLFIFTFISLFSQFYIFITQRRVTNKIFFPFFMYFLGFYSSLYLFLSELYPYERFGFSETQAVFIVICSCILIPLLHATVNSIIIYFVKFLPKNFLSALGISALWVVGEWILSLGSLAFPWGNIAISLIGWLPYLQTISLFGKSFITFITVFACYSFAFAIAENKKLFAYFGIAVLVFNITIGSILWFMPTDYTQTTKVAAIQGNVLSNEKWSYSNRNDIFESYISMTETAAKNGAEIIVLPESAIPTTFKENGNLHNSLSNITLKYDVTIIIGVNYSENGNQYNSVIAVLPDGTLSDRYDKRHLVPFGEFIPLVDLIGKIVPFVGEFSEDSGAYAEGDKPIVIETEHGNIAPLVCFDSIFPQFSREVVNNNADLLCVVTNDSWFNDSVGIYTHLRHSQLRAIENKRSVIRAANTGISAFVNEKGEIITSTEALTKDILFYDINSCDTNTMFTCIGDVTLLISFIIIVILFLYNIRRISNGNNTVTQN